MTSVTSGLQVGSVRVAWASVAGSEWPVTTLNDVERARADRFLRAVDRARFTAAHVLLRRVVAELVRAQPAGVAVGSRCHVCDSTEHGRPVLLTDPTVQLSLSSSADRVVVAVALGGDPIGVDVEAVAATRFAGFDDVALCAAEGAVVYALPERDRAAARADAWTRTEAVLKARGVGLTVDPSTVDPAFSGYALTRVDVGAGYACWLAATGNGHGAP